MGRVSRRCDVGGHCFQDRMVARMKIEYLLFWLFIFAVLLTYFQNEDMFVRDLRYWRDVYEPKTVHGTRNSP